MAHVRLRQSTPAFRLRVSHARPASDRSMTTRARLTLAAALLTLVAGWLWPSRAHLLPASTVVRGIVVSDAGTFAAIVERLRAGEPYYVAFGQELRRRDYPTDRVFNWRTPLQLVALSRVPWAVSRGVLTVLLVVLFAWTMVQTGTRPLLGRLAGALQLGVLVQLSAQDGVYFGEVWSGVFVCLSLLAYLAGRWGLGVGTAVAALFVRELAAIYCATAALQALAERRWREVGAWFLSGAAYAIYYAWHVLQVDAHQIPSDFSQGTRGWIAFGGLPFLQATVHNVGWLKFLPGQLDAAVLALIVAGILHNETPLRLRTASLAFAGFFLVVGQPFNAYWGWMVSPLWALAAAYGACALLDLASVQRPVRPPTATMPRPR